MSTPTSQPAILVLGGTGTVGSRLVHQLTSPSHSSHTVLVASRNGTSNSPPQKQEQEQEREREQPTRLHHIPFDWENTDTWSNPWGSSSDSPTPSSTTTTTTTTTTARKISAIYLIAPPTLKSDSLMTEFIDFARARGVRRFVLQSASPIEAGGPAMGKVHGYLRELGQRGEVEWAVLRPTWFQQNFADQPVHVRGIKEESKIYSATGQGKIPWVSADDIAAVAVRALTDEEPWNTDHLVLGPELLSYTEIAGILSEVLGRRIVHVELSPAELEKRHQSFDMPEDYARMMSAMDTSIKFGSENRTNDVVLAVTGTAPRKFRDFAKSVKGVWATGDKS